MKLEISEEMKKAGFTYREPDKNHPKYKLAQQLCQEIEPKKYDGSSTTSRAAEQKAAKSI